MPRHRFRRLTAAIVGIVGSAASLLSIATAQARPEGEPQPCGNCHYEPRGPEIKVSFSNDTPDPGETITITIDLTARTSNARRTGLMIQSTGGTFELIEADSTKRESETKVLHSMPRDLVDRKAQFQFRWQAPNKTGVTDFYLYSISSNDSGDASSYNASEARAGVARGCEGIYYYPDDDGDGYGADFRAQLSCEPITGWITQGGDCYDNDPAIYPGAPERCNAQDDNCNGEVDEGLDPGLYYRDQDGDTWGAEAGRFACNDTPNLTNRGGDCDDNDPEVHPDAEEICDGKDNNCDGKIDNVPGGCDENDRDDKDPEIHPDAGEICDSKDNDCDGEIDDVPLPPMIKRSPLPEDDKHSPLPEDNNCDVEIDNVPDGCDGNSTNPSDDQPWRSGGCKVVQSAHSNDMGTLWGLGLGLMLALARGRSTGKPMGQKDSENQEWRKLRMR